YRAGRARLRGIDRVLRRSRVQPPDAVRGLPGRGAERPQPTVDVAPTHGGAVVGQFARPASNRGRGGRLTGPSARHVSLGVKRADFERLVATALDAIPAEFAGYLANVAVLIEDQPSAALLRDLGMDPCRDTLYGLYEGTALPERTHDFTALPDRITLYAGAL